MSLTDKKPLKYTEVAAGELDRMMQEHFLKAHKLSSEYNQKVSISAEIVVYPPDPRMPKNGNVSFSVQLKEPKYTSQRFTTALVGGLPVNEGRNEAEAEQYNAFDQTPEIVENSDDKPEVV